MKVLNFGSLNIDRIYQVKSFVSPGETVKSEHYSEKVGGKGLNQSVALARAGLHVCHAGCIGKDGDFLVEYLKNDGVDTAFIRVSEVPTGHAVIQVDQNGENCILLYGGANQSITREYAQTVLGAFSQGDIIILQNEINLVEFIMKTAHEKGMKIFFNPSPITDSLLKLPVDCVDLFILNEIEGEALSETNDLQKMTEKLTEKFPNASFVLTLGEKGAVYFDKTQKISVEAENVSVIDTTAAGDTFTGYFVAGITKGMPTQDALRLASKAAGKAVTVSGAADSIPRIENL